LILIQEKQKNKQQKSVLHFLFPILENDRILSIDDISFLLLRNLMHINRLYLISIIHTRDDRLDIFIMNFND